MPANTLNLLHQFAPGPISFMLDLNETSPLRFATCGSQQVIARIPNHPLFLSIIKSADCPLLHLVRIRQEGYPLPVQKWLQLILELKFQES